MYDKTKNFRFRRDYHTCSILCVDVERNDFLILNPIIIITVLIFLYGLHRMIMKDILYLVIRLRGRIELDKENKGELRNDKTLITR